MTEENKIKSLLEKYYAGESSLEEEMELSLFFNSSAFLGDLEKHRAEFLLPDHFKSESPSENFKANLLSQFETPQSWVFKQKRVLGIAASLLLMLTSFALGRWTKQIPRDQNTSVQRLETEVAELKLLTASILLEQSSASQRLQGIEILASFSDISQEIPYELLFKVLNEDQNPNVRLASTAVLKQIKHSEETKRLLVRALLKQDSPILQMELLRLMETLNIQIEQESLEEMIEKDQLDDTIFQLIMEKI